MSIYCSIFDFGYEHPPKCARVKPLKGYGRNVYEQDNSKRCTCGSCPIGYRGSNMLPSDRDPRVGEFGIAAIPSHITRDGRDDKPEGGNWYPWLRVSLFAGEDDTIILTRKQVAELRDALTQWLERSGKPKARQRIKKRSKRQVGA